MIDKSRRPDPGIVLLVSIDGFNQFARWMGDALITEEGEAIEGEALDGVIVIGPVIALNNAVGRDDDCPVLLLGMLSPKLIDS